MRQRKVKNLEQRYEPYQDLIVWQPAEEKGHWRELFADAPADQADSGEPIVANDGRKELFLEIGCGKGKFISEIAERYPDRDFVAIEGNRSVMLRAMEKIRRNGLTNVRFVPHYIFDLRDWFEDQEADGIYLNFSDPLPKAKTAKNRLTHRSKLAQYADVLTDDGIVTFKTDNTGMFEYTIQEIHAADLAILELTRDLHHCEFGEDDIRTEYEYKFSELGERIKRVKFGRKTEDKTRGH